MPNRPPRIPPLDPTVFTAEQRDVVGPWSILNFSRVLAHHPALYRVYVPFIEKVISNTDLPPWDREILCIRTLWQCGDTYEIDHHADIARDKVAMTDAQIASIKAEGAELSDFDRTLMKAADELVDDHHISRTTWKRLSQRYSRVQLMEIVGLVGCCSTMAMVTRTFEIPLEGRQERAGRLAELRTYT